MLRHQVVLSAMGAALAACSGLEVAATEDPPLREVPPSASAVAPPPAAGFRFRVNFLRACPKNSCAWSTPKVCWRGVLVRGDDGAGGGEGFNGICAEPLAVKNRGTAIVEVRVAGLRPGSYSLRVQPDAPFEGISCAARTHGADTALAFRVQDETFVCP